jgi:hypothetical protein
MQRIEEPSEKEQAWIAQQLKSAADFVSAFSPCDSGKQLSLGALDRAFAKWIASGLASNAAEANKVINCVGIAFGDLLSRGIGLKWVIATDEKGGDLAVYGLPNTGDVLVYPANFVAKRWEQRKSNFLEDSYGQIEREVRSLQSQWESHTRQGGAQNNH